MLFSCVGKVAENVAFPTFFISFASVKKLLLSL
nr:MAG TPA: hypothetical protein [Bacteriophage sp.]DAU19554.1 MAG TPA: hypothetical protein [Crassvirales sp.]